MNEKKCHGCGWMQPADGMVTHVYRGHEVNRCASCLAQDSENRTALERGENPYGSWPSPSWLHSE